MTVTCRDHNVKVNRRNVTFLESFTKLTSLLALSKVHLKPELHQPGGKNIGR